MIAVIHTFHVLQTMTAGIHAVNCSLRWMSGNYSQCRICLVSLDRTRLLGAQYSRALTTAVVVSIFLVRGFLMLSFFVLKEEPPEVQFKCFKIKREAYSEMKIRGGFFFTVTIIPSLKFTKSRASSINIKIFCYNSLWVYCNKVYSGIELFVLIVF